MTALLWLKALPWRIILPVMGAVLALWAAYDWAYDRGRDTERAAWEKETARLRAVAAQEAQARAMAVNSAEVETQRATAALAALANHADQERKVYYVQNPTAVRACLDAGRLRAIAQADAAAYAAATTSP